MTFDHIEISRAEYRRLQAWCVCLEDASNYLALSRGLEKFLQENDKFPISGGWISIRHNLQKGMIAAAIVSAGQIFKNGDKGENISSANSPALLLVRERLFIISDQKNAWTQGRSLEIFKRLVEHHRDKFVSHFDGKAAAVQEKGGNAISWNRPNPSFRADKFIELENVTNQMHSGLLAIMKQQESRIFSAEK